MYKTNTNYRFITKSESYLYNTKFVLILKRVKPWNSLFLLFSQYKIQFPSILILLKISSYPNTLQCHAAC